MNIISNLLKILQPQEKLMLLLILGSIFFTMLLEMLSIAIIIPFLTLIIDAESLDTQFFSLDLSFLQNIEQEKILNYLLITFIFFYLIKSLILSYFVWLQNQFGYKLLVRLSSKLFGKYLKISFTQFINRNPADFTRNIEHEVRNMPGAILSVLNLLSDCLILSGIIIVILVYEPSFFLIASITFLIIVLFYIMIVRKFFANWGKKRVLITEIFLQTLFQSLASFKVIKIHNKENYFINKFKKNLIDMSKISRNFFILNSMPRIWLELIVIILIYILYLYVNNFLKMPFEKIILLIAIFSAASFKILPSLNRILNSIQSLQFAKYSINYIYDELNIYEDLKTYNIESNLKIDQIFKKKIQLKNVFFKYNENNFLFENLNLEIKKNCITGIIGESGSGKTTILNILIGLVKPYSGSILIDENEMKYNLSNWHNNIGYVPQNVYISDDSIKNNICYGVNNNDIDENRLNKAIEKSQLDKYITSLPEGVETILGDRGSRLSGGQTQRIGLARALYRDPQILILDESTSSLDLNTEEKIVNSVLELKGQITIIIVSHRTSTIKDADEIFLVKDGKISLKN